jgi:hypothetical protein
MIEDTRVCRTPFGVACRFFHALILHANEVISGLQTGKSGILHPDGWWFFHCSFVVIICYSSSCSVVITVHAGVHC